MISIAAADIDMTCSVTGCPEHAGSPVTVEVRGKFQLITPLLSLVFGGQTIPTSASSATAQIEYLPDPQHGHPAARPGSLVHRQPDDRIRAA